MSKRVANKRSPRKGKWARSKVKYGWKTIRDQFWKRMIQRSQEGTTA